MKKEGFGVAIGTGLALLSVIGVMASNIADATFYGTIQISNNGSLATNQPVTFTLNTTNLISSGFVNAALNNTAMRNDANADTAYMPGLTPNSWVVFVNSIPGPGAHLNYTLYTGGNHTMNSSLAYFPTSAGMNVTANTSLNFGDNFTTSYAGYIDTTQNNTFWSQLNSYSFNYSSGGVVSATFNWTPNTSQNTSPIMITAGAGDVTQLLVTGPPTNWQAVQTDDGAGSYVRMPGANQTDYDLYTFNGTTAGLAGINSITVYVISAVNLPATNNSQVTPTIKTHGVTYNGTTYNLTNASGVFASYNTTWATNPFTGTNWTQAEVNSLQAGVVQKLAEANDVWTTQVYVLVSTGTPAIQPSSNPFTINVTGIAAGYHIVTANLSAHNLTFRVDSTSNSSVFNVPIPAGIGNITIAAGVPYMVGANVSINGTQQARWTWQYGTLFYDLAGNGHTATPSFLTTTPSPNLTANMTTFQPVVQSVSVPNGTALVAANITSTFISPPHMFTELSITAPGADFINSVLNGVGIPRALFWFPFLFGITNLIGLLVAFLTKSIFVECAFMGVLLVLFSLMGGFGFWVCLEYIIGASAIVVFSKQFGF